MLLINKINGQYKQINTIENYDLHIIGNFYL
ncbi:hypothetical protein SH1V18_24420 [Vallitalea longa]|uniref:Uncharacterized protein n=1 Tax=Vallitalea longa TaxID=2936439 RepID=A0A9W5Y9U2_9FIRM|nr:hypothetical protein SH1V18_24420 [Vallitalea longa]